MPKKADRVETDLFETLSRLKSPEHLREFFVDLCTPAEIQAMSDRWKVAQLLAEGVPYREIYAKTGVSTATVTRVARCLTFGEGYQLGLIEKCKIPLKKIK